MTQDDRPQEDVAGLFRKFGGDATRYKEFAPEESPRAQGAWPLVNGRRGAAETAAPPAHTASVAPPTPTPASAPAPAAPAVVASPGATPAATPATEAAEAAAAPRELDALFARLAGVAPPTTAAGQGLMSHWRRSG